MFTRSKKPEKISDKLQQIDPKGAAVRPTASAAPPTSSGAAMQPSAKPQTAAQADQAPDLAPEELKRRAAAIKLVSAAFGQVVSVLMRAPHYKHYSLADLEWMVVPPLVTSQFSIVEAQSRKNGMSAPVCVVFWANVSAEVDARLSASPGEPIRLKPNEWRSGDILWVIDAIGDARAVTAVLKRLRENEWKGRAVKIRTRTKDGKAVVRVLDAAPAKAEAPPA
jgi:hemolysin-activating ACP:hemolysin acyltransferase